MKAFSAGLTLVNVATMAGLLLGIVGGGLDEGFAGLALLLGLAAAIYAWIGTAPFSLRKVTPVPPPPAVAEIEARPAPDEAEHADRPSSATPSLAFLGVGGGHRFCDVRGPLVLLAPVDRWEQPQDSVA